MGPDDDRDNQHNGCASSLLIEYSKIMSYDICLFWSFGLAKGQKGKKAQIFVYKLSHKIAFLV